MRNPQQMFQAAIEAGHLSAKPGDANYAGDFMYIMDDENGRALFKNINDRSYLPAMELTVTK